MSPSESPTLKDSVVAFIDILGYRELVKEAEAENKGQEFLSSLYSVLDKGKKWLSGESVIIKIGKRDTYAISTFTDNIVIGYPIRSDAETEFGSIFFKLCYLQLEMVLAGFFIRGAISIGKLYLDDLVVSGGGSNLCI